jgi:hypothetical protein
MATFLLLSGCAHYEFDLTSPHELACHISDSGVQTVTVPPLRYDMQSAEGRLVLLVHNSSDDQIQLLGGESAVVDPQGQSHPLADALIAPASYMKIILPPMPGEVVPNGPRITIGAGYISAMRKLPPAVSPVYCDVIGSGDPSTWDWSGEGDVRLILTFKQAEKGFQQEFVFHRRRM